MSEKVLVVDDDCEIRELLVDYLQAADYQVITAGDGQTALDLARQHKPDLLVLDIMMPGMDGFEVCRILRHESSVPILMLSARQEEADKVLALGLGADDYVSKPFSPREVVARVKAQLRRASILSQTNGSTSLRFGDLEIDIAGYSIKLKGETVSLTTREFEILKFLMLNPGRVFSRGQLFEHVWGEECLGDSNALMVHIRHLREKIEDNPAKPVYIKTVWGVGYKFAGEV